MKLHFSWLQSEGDMSPNCSSAAVNMDGASPLCCLLMDDGGQRFLDAISWLSEGINRISSVKVFDVEVADWSRDAWGAELTKGWAKIYSLHDEGCFELLDIDSFEMALLAWRDFIQSKPEAGVTKVIEL
ncbi:hypothetical protein [Janthinobacterium fluminis]|uniref:Uncharacterized protein n=1 Tax=Janthinobacterium fluminis TaxID=2987524 RepID=A0ABT5JWU9_9BURK|nr:hypothetical protein [Janthinobacterium fluminis]MDC8757114.1 hypothetical protein [Janthinobacterium fluminis]